MKKNQGVAGYIILVALYVLCFPLGVIMTLAKAYM